MTAVATPRPPGQRRSKSRIDPENLPKGFELVNDVLTEKNGMGFQSGFMTVRLIVMISNFLERTRLGVIVGSDATFACVPGNPRQVRKPDAAVILCDPQTFVAPVGNYTSAPDIVIEVTSPSDTIGSLDSRIAEFLAAGSKEAWIVYPQRRSVEIHRPDGTIQYFKTNGTLNSELLPGFSMPLTTLFA